MENSHKEYNDKVGMDDIEVYNKIINQNAFNMSNVQNKNVVIELRNGKREIEKESNTNNFIQNEESDSNDLQVVEKFNLPISLKKTFICSITLLSLGLTLLILGFIQDVQAADPGKGLTFWILGGIVIIPGGYYCYQFYKAKKAKSLEERDEILDEIPAL